MSLSHSFLLISLSSFGLFGIRYSLNFPNGALASAISVVHEQSSSSFSSEFVFNTSGAVVDRLILAVGVVSGDDSELTDDISSLSDAFFLMSFPPVLGRIFACIGFAAVPTLGVTEVANSLLLLYELGPLPPVGGPLPPGGGPLPPGGGPLPPGGGPMFVSE